jgi:undecaprenyl pyrophosphate phosphatase UppP
MIFVKIGVSTNRMRHYTPMAHRPQIGVGSMYERGIRPGISRSGAHSLASAAVGCMPS